MNKDRNIRRLQVALHSRGEGVILFSLWSFVEVLMMLFSTTDLSDGMAELSDPRETTVVWFFYILFFLVLSLILGANLGINVYIGRSAIGFGHGKKVRRAPLIWSGLYAAFYTVILVGEFVLVFGSGMAILNFLSLAMDVFIIVLHIEIIVFARRLKKAGA